MVPDIVLVILGAALMIWGIKKLREPLTQEEIDKIIAEDEERIRKYIEEKEKARRLKKERQ